MKSERAIGGVSGLPSLPSPRESRASLLFSLLVIIALGVLVFGPDNAFIQQDFPFS